MLDAGRGHPPRTRGGGDDVNVGAVILAAGGSSRLGSPKQLLDFRGRSLLRHAAETALAAGCRPVVVVLGSGAERLRPELAGLAVHAVENPEWSEGMGTSIRRGLETLGSLAPGLDGALLMLCDQPLIGPAALRALAEAGRPDGIAAAAYHGIVGVPAVFGRTFFDELRALAADAGAKPLLRRHAGIVVEVALPEAATDIDTRAQYERLTFP